MPHALSRTRLQVLSAASIVVLLATALPLSLFAPSTALGDSTWVVTSLADDGGEGTLRYAVDNSDGGDIICFAASVRGTITLDPVLGQLVLDHPLTIEGPGASRLAISGANGTRVLFMKGPPKGGSCYPTDEEDPAAEDGCCSGGGGCALSEGACAADDATSPGQPLELVDDPDFVISGLTIRDGFPESPLPYPCIPNNPEKDPHGPGCFGGNVLCVRTSVALIGCVIKYGFAEQGGGVAARNDTSLLLQRCTIYYNEAGDTGTEFTQNGQGQQDTTNGGGGLDIRNNTAVRLEDCSIHNNTAGAGGGGVSARGSTLVEMEGCTIRDNDANAEGGGVAARNHTDITMEDCDILDNTAVGAGGGIAARAGGGSSENGSVSLKRCSISGNEVAVAEEVPPRPAPEPGSGGGCSGDEINGGGGIHAKKLTSLVLEDCVIEDNVVNDGEERLAAGGGILLKRTSTTISGSSISNNAAGTGEAGGFAGGIACLNSDMQVRTCIIIDNSAGNGSNVAAGGGIYIGQGDFNTYADEPGIGGNLYLIEITDSLIAGNTAGSSDAFLAAGGGIGMGRYEFLQGDLRGDFLEPSPVEQEPDSGLDDNLGTVLTNCTISGNAAINSDNTSSGGGITNTGSKSLALNFCTVTENSSSYASGLSTLYPQTPQTAPEGCQPKLRVKNSIVAGNPCLEEAFEIEGSMMSWEGNVLGGVSDVGAPEPGDCYNGGCGDITIEGDPLLGPLADNGGPTKTHALLPGSPAVDAACDCKAIGLVFFNPTEPAAVEEVTVEMDQRGSYRPVDGDGDGEERADAGAYECLPDIALPDVAAGGINAGEAVSGSCRQVRVLVTNEGAATLTIGDILILGSNAFSVVGDYSGTLIEGGGSLWVKLLFCPRTAGVSSGTLRIVSNDPDEAPLDVTIRGTGVREQDRTVEPSRLVTNYLLIDPQQVLPGQAVTVSANVCNSGGEGGSQTATFAVNGVAEQSQSVTVSPGACKQVVFTAAKSVPGTYDVSINGMQGQFTVVAPRTVQSTIASQQDTGIGTAGIIAIVAVVLALIGALVMVFKQS